MDLINGATLVIIVVTAAVLAAFVAYRHRNVLRLFSSRSHIVQIGPLSFRLRYIHSLRNPSGRLIFIWTDELGRTYEQIDPRVLVWETTGSVFSRLLRRDSESEADKYANAVKKHIGHGIGWAKVSELDTYRIPLLRSIAFCIAHIEIGPASRAEAITNLQLWTHERSWLSNRT